MIIMIYSAHIEYKALCSSMDPQWIVTEKILLSLNNTEPYLYYFNSTSPRCIQQLDHGHLLSSDWVLGLRMLMFNSKLSIKLVIELVFALINYIPLYM